jgi:hypothetical protein
MVPTAVLGFSPAAFMCAVFAEKFGWGKMLAIYFTVPALQLIQYAPLIISFVQNWIEFLCFADPYWLPFSDLVFCYVLAVSVGGVVLIHSGVLFSFHIIIHKLGLYDRFSL